MSVETQKETLGFQTEVKQLLHLMIHSLYSNKEIFLRELISNASDAVDKLRFEALSTPELLEGGAELKIRVSFDKDAKTVTLEDNGIGMSREDVITHLGTIAKSGTADFMKNLSGDQKKDSHLIGQFGVGFYSAFIVADQVEVFSRRAGTPASEGVHWSSKGEGEFEVATVDKADRGTRIVLHLKNGEENSLTATACVTSSRNTPTISPCRSNCPKSRLRQPKARRRRRWSGKPSTAPAHSGPVRAPR